MSIVNLVEPLLHLDDVEIGQRLNKTPKYINAIRRKLCGNSGYGWTPAAKAWVLAQTKLGTKPSAIAAEIWRRFGIEKSEDAIIGFLWRARGGKGSKPLRPKKKAAPVAAVTIATSAPGPDSLHLVPLIELELRSCRWPVGDPQSPNFGFCPRQAESGSYCDSHRRLAYQPQSAPRPSREAA